MSSVETNKQTKSYSSVFHLQQETSLWEIWLKSYLITLADMSGGKYVCDYCLDNNYKIIHCLANWITINQFYLLQNWIIFDFLTWGWAHPHQGNKRIEASNAFIEVKRHIHMHAHAYTHMHSHICTHPSHTQSLASFPVWRNGCGAAMTQLCETMSYFESALPGPQDRVNKAAWDPLRLLSHCAPVCLTPAFKRTV